MLCSCRTSNGLVGGWVGGGLGLPSLYTHRVVTSSVSSSSQGSFKMHQVSSIMDSHRDWASVRPDRRGVYPSRKRKVQRVRGRVRTDADIWKHCHRSNWCDPWWCNSILFWICSNCSDLSRKITTRLINTAHADMRLVFFWHSSSLFKPHVEHLFEYHNIRFKWGEMHWICVTVLNLGSQTKLLLLDPVSAQLTYFLQHLGANTIMKVLKWPESDSWLNWLISCVCVCTSVHMAGVMKVYIEHLRSRMKHREIWWSSETWTDNMHYHNDSKSVCVCTCV